MPEHRIKITYHAENEGSRIKLFRILDEGGFGRIQNISQYEDNRMLYEISIFSEYDPEELLYMLRSPSEGGIFILLMIVDEHHVIFKHPKYEKMISHSSKKRRNRVIR